MVVLQVLHRNIWNLDSGLLPLSRSLINFLLSLLGIHRGLLDVSEERVRGGRVLEVLAGTTIHEHTGMRPSISLGDVNSILGKDNLILRAHREAQKCGQHTGVVVVECLLNLEHQHIWASARGRAVVESEAAHATNVLRTFRAVLAKLLTTAVVVHAAVKNEVARENGGTVDRRASVRVVKLEVRILSGRCTNGRHPNLRLVELHGRIDKYGRTMMHVVS